MSVITTFNFTTPANYSAVDAEIVGGLGCLKLVEKAALTFLQDFDDSAGFTFDAAATTFQAGTMRQKDARPTNAILHANFNTNEDANWGQGTLTGTLVGGAVVAGGLLDCKGDTLKNAEWDEDNVSSATQVGAMRCIYIPNYTGNPATTRAIFSLGQNAGGINLLRLGQLNNGTFQLIINSSSGAGITVGSFTAFSFTAGVSHELELNWDLNTGAHRLFIDGVQQGATAGGTGTRSTAIDDVKLGAAHAAAVTSDAEFDDFVVFNLVQHTADYTPLVPIVATIFLADTIDLPVFNYTTVGAIQALTNLAVTEVGTPRYTLEGQFWNGSVWAASDGSYAEANTLAVVNTNIAALDVAGETALSVQVLWDNGNVDSTVDSMVLTYTGQKYPLLGTLLTNNSFVASAISTFTDVVVIPANTEIRFIFEINGQDRWHDGNNFADSDGTAAESNTLAELQAVIGTALANNATIKIKVLLITTDDQLTPCIDSMTVTYDFGSIEPAEPLKSNVFGFLIDVLGNPIAGATLNIEPDREVAEYREASARLVGRKITKITDGNGFFNVPLVRSSEYETGASTPMVYKLTIDLPDAETTLIEELQGDTIRFTVPDLPEVNLTDQLVAF